MKFDVNAIRIRVTLVDPDNWEPLDLYFKFLDTPLAKKWYKEFVRIKSGPHSVRESSLKSNAEVLSEEKCKNILTKIVRNINTFYDQPLTPPSDISEETLNYLHECYEKYGERNERLLEEGYWDTAYLNIPENSPFAKRWPGITFNEFMHQNFIELNEWIHKTETLATSKEEPTPYGIITHSLNPRTDFNLAEVDYDNLVKFPYFGDFCLGYNTLGKNLEHIVLDQDKDAIDRSAIIPQKTWSSEIYIYLGGRNINCISEYKDLWDKLEVTEKLGYTFGDWKTNREGYLKIAEFDRSVISDFYYGGSATTKQKINIDFSKFSKVQDIQIVPDRAVGQTGENRYHRWKDIPENQGKVIDKILAEEQVITWVLNNACTYNCRYCPADLHTGSNTRWSWEQVEPFLKEVLERYDNPRFALSGGEPTVSPFFPQLVREIVEQDASVGMTTNLTRSIRFIKENFGYLQYAACSFHPSMVFPRNDDDVFIEKIKVAEQYTNCTIRIMMDVDYWDETVHFIDKLFNDPDLNSNVEIVYIQNQYGGSVEKVCDISYTKEQQEYIINFKNKNTEYVAPKYIVRKVKSYPSTIFYEDGSQQVIRSPQHHINLGETRFFDYTCHIGKDSLFIGHEGDINKGNCKLGGVVGNIENYKDIDWADVKRPIKCTIGWCQCGADVPISKVKPLS
jgi:MoaA/NifB/PqqE/SkfB family radical SAM enzyme